MRTGLDLLSNAAVTEDWSSDQAIANNFDSKAKAYILDSRSPQEAKARAAECTAKAAALGLSAIVAASLVYNIKKYLNQWNINQGRVGQRGISDAALVGGLIVGGLVVAAVGFKMIW
jgi:hypothetical protein